MDVMQVEGMILDCGKGKLTMDSHYGFTTSFTRSEKEAVAFRYEITAKTARRCFHETTSKILQITAISNAKSRTKPFLVHSALAPHLSYRPKSCMSTSRPPVTPYLVVLAVQTALADLTNHGGKGTGRDVIRFSSEWCYPLSFCSQVGHRRHS